MSPEPLAEALKRIASGQINTEDLAELQKAVASGWVTITTASNGGVAVAGNVSGGMVRTFTLPPSSHVPFSANAIFTGRREYLGELARELLYAWGNTESPGRLASGPEMLRTSSEDIPRKARRGSS